MLKKNNRRCSKGVLFSHCGLELTGLVWTQNAQIHFHSRTHLCEKTPGISPDRLWALPTPHPFLIHTAKLSSWASARPLNYIKSYSQHKTPQFTGRRWPPHPPPLCLDLKGSWPPGTPPQTPPYNTSVPSSLLCWGDSSLSQIEIKARIQSIESPHHLQPSRTPVTRSLHHVLASFILTSELQVAQLWIKVLLWLYISKKLKKNKKCRKRQKTNGVKSGGCKGWLESGRADRVWSYFSNLAVQELCFTALAGWWIIPKKAALLIVSERAWIGGNLCICSNCKTCTFYLYCFLHLLLSRELWIHWKCTIFFYLAEELLSPTRFQLYIIFSFRTKDSW